MSKFASEEVKQQALEEVRSGTPVSQVAEKLGRTKETIRNWMRKSGPQKRAYTKRRTQLVTLTVPAPTEARKLIAFYGTPLEVCQALDSLTRSLQ